MHRKMIFETIIGSESGLDLSGSFECDEVIGGICPGKEDCGLCLWCLVHNVPETIETCSLCEIFFLCRILVSDVCWSSIADTWIVWQLHSWIQLLSVQGRGYCSSCGAPCLVVEKESGRKILTWGTRFTDLRLFGSHLCNPPIGQNNSHAQNMFSSITIPCITW